MTTTGLLILALLPTIAAVSPDPTSPFDAVPPSRMPVAIAQPLGRVENAPLVTLGGSHGPVLPESGMLLLVGSALFGLATLVRRTTRT